VKEAEGSAADKSRSRFKTQMVTSIERGQGEEAVKERAAQKKAPRSPVGALEDSGEAKTRSQLQRQFRRKQHGTN